MRSSSPEIASCSWPSTAHVGAMPLAVPAFSPSAGQLQMPVPTAQGAGEGFWLTPVWMRASYLLCWSHSAAGLDGEKGKGRICAIHAKLCTSGRKLLCFGELIEKFGEEKSELGKIRCVLNLYSGLEGEG